MIMISRRDHEKIVCQLRDNKAMIAMPTTTRKYYICMHPLRSRYFPIQTNKELYTQRLFRLGHVIRLDEDVQAMWGLVDLDQENDRVYV